MMTYSEFCSVKDLPGTLPNNSKRDENRYCGKKSTSMQEDDRMDVETILY